MRPVWQRAVLPGEQLQQGIGVAGQRGTIGLAAGGQAG